MRLWATGSLVLSLAELFVSAVIHLCYGLYIFSTAVASDISEILSNHWLKKSQIWNYRAWETIGNCYYNKPNILAPDGGRDVGKGPFLQGRESAPIVLVHGIFGFGKGRLGGLSYWAGAENKDEFVLMPDLGSLTSIYDRARELFYYLKGGTIDYGEEHSARYGHAQFGKTYEHGHYPEWDENHPVHFVGHSAGVQVIRVLQQMLAEKKFKGYEYSSEDWVLSVTSLSGALNGSTRVYLDGMQPEDGKTMKPICLLQLCRLGVVIYDWLDIAWLKNYYNFGFDHFNMSWRKVGISGLVDGLLGNIGPFATEDWILPDLSLQASVELNASLRTFPNTYYFSYATKRTRKLFGLTVPSSLFGIHPLLLLRTLQMSQWHHPSNVSPPYKGYRLADGQFLVFVIFIAFRFSFSQPRASWQRRGLATQRWRSEHRIHAVPSFSRPPSQLLDRPRFQGCPVFASRCLVRQPSDAPQARNIGYGDISESVTWTLTGIIRLWMPITFSS